MQFYLLKPLILFSFVVMNFLKKLYKKGVKTLTFSASDPKSFVEVWSFSSSRFRVLSLIILLILILLGVSIYFISPLINNEPTTGSVRTELESNEVKIDSLIKKVEVQDRYINAIQLILSGEVPINSNLDSLMGESSFFIDSLDSERSSAEELLLDKVQDDLTDNSSDSKVERAYFATPIKGIVSQEFDQIQHFGIDIVAKKGAAVKVCLSGTIIYAGYTRNDGNIGIVDHGNGFTSVYKHNKTIFKKIGDKVKMGDPIAIVGNTGEHSDGPHLHFELWFNQVPVNPTEYINF